MSACPFKVAELNNVFTKNDNLTVCAKVKMDTQWQNKTYRFGWAPNFVMHRLKRNIGMFTTLTLRRDFDFVSHWNVHVICYLLPYECVCLRHFSVFFWISGCESQSFGKHPNNLINTSLKALWVLHFVTSLQQRINSRSIMSIQHSTQHNTMSSSKVLCCVRTQSRLADIIHHVSPLSLVKSWFTVAGLKGHRRTCCIKLSMSTCCIWPSSFTFRMWPGWYEWQNRWWWGCTTRKLALAGQFDLWGLSFLWRVTNQRRVGADSCTLHRVRSWNFPLYGKWSENIENVHDKILLGMNWLFQGNFFPSVKYH